LIPSPCFLKSLDVILLSNFGFPVKLDKELLGTIRAVQAGK
jgi:hypothetical protein